MKSGIAVTVIFGILVSGCQNHTPVKTKVQEEADFRRDTTIIEQFGSAHPWSGSDRAEDIPQALARIEATKAKGTAYISAQDRKYAREQQILTQADQKKQEAMDSYERSEAAKVNKHPMGSFGTAYFKLYQLNRFQPYFDEMALTESEIQQGVFTLDIPFTIIKCDHSFCLASSDTFSVQPAISILTPQTPALRPGIRLPYYLVDVMGINDIGILVVRLLAPAVPTWVER